MSQPRSAGGLGTTGTSVLFRGVILALVVFLAVTQVDRTELITSVQSHPDDEPDKVGRRLDDCSGVPEVQPAAREIVKATRNPIVVISPV